MNYSVFEMFYELVVRNLFAAKADLTRPCMNSFPCTDQVSYLLAFENVFLILVSNSQNSKHI